MDKSAALAKIQKLMALANDLANENESASALAKAEEMMRKFAITSAELDDADRSAIDGLDVDEIKVPAAEWYAKVGWALGIFTATHVSRHRRRDGWHMIVAGRKSDRLIFAHLLQVCIREINRNAKNYRLATRATRREMTQFRSSAADGLRAQIEDMRTAQEFAQGDDVPGLVLARNQEAKDTIEKWRRERGLHASRVTSKAGNNADGFRVGKNIQLRSAVTSTAPRQRQLTGS